MNALPCPDENDVVAFADAKLAEAERAGVEAHLAECSSCRRLVADLIALDRPAPAPSPPRLSRLGRYVLLETIGQGAMGVIFAAYDAQLDRRIALKVLHPFNTSAEARERLLREAQALGRLSHPNVVTVHDVGQTDDGQVFVAMELVDGGTLRAWAQEPRGWRAVLQAFEHAGRGLAAAHAAGVIHRDFKPDNVLIGKDGRVRVTDFGLATAVEHARASPGPPADDLGAPLLGADLTRSGSVLGTPAYMSLEQLLGGACDARSDQFSFCVALYQALYGERPFDGETLGAFAAAIGRGEVRPAPRGRDVPAWLRKRVLRGLAASPDERYPDMEALLDALRRDPTARWRRAGIGIGLTAAVLAAGLLYQRSVDQQRRTCRDAERRLAGVWDAGVQRAVRDAFAATGRPSAPSAFAGVQAALGAYTRAWGQGRTEACEATRLRREQSEAALALRYGCLDQRLAEVRALAGLFQKASPEVVDRAVAAAEAVQPLGACADVAALEAAQLPEDPARRAEVADIRGELAEAKARFDAGQYAKGLERAKPLVERARAVAYRPVEAEVLLLLGRLYMRTDDGASAREALEAAVWAAQAGRSAELAARAWLTLGQAVGYFQAKPEEGARLLRYAASAVEGLGAGNALEGDLHVAQGLVSLAQGKHAEAVAEYHQALVAVGRSRGSDTVEFATILNNLGLAYGRLGRYEEALQAHERARAIRVKRLGPQHIDVAVSENNIGVVYEMTGKYDQALECHQRALEIRRATYGPEHAQVAGSLLNIANMHFHARRYAEAAAGYERALPPLEKAFGPDHPQVVPAVYNLGMVKVEMGAAAEGLPYLQRAVAMVEKKLGASHSSLVELLDGEASAYLALRAPARALPLIERALEISKAGGVPPESVAVARGHLAQALWEGGSRDRAKRMALEARDQLRTAPGSAEELAKLERWLAAH